MDWIYLLAIVLPVPRRRRHDWQRSGRMISESQTCFSKWGHVVEDEESFRETLQVEESAQVDLGSERVWSIVEQKMVHFKVAEQMKVAITASKSAVMTRT